MRAKLICKHSPAACWVSNFSADHPGIKLYAYPLSGSFQLPTIYSVAVVVVIPKDKVRKYVKDFDRKIDAYTRSWPPRVILEKIPERKAENGDLHLRYFMKADTLELISVDREKIKAYSFLYALFRQDSPPRSLRWICSESGSEYTFPVFNDTSTWKENVEHLKSLKLDSQQVCDIIFPKEERDYASDYSKEFADQPDPLGELFAERLKDFPISFDEFPTLDEDTIRELFKIQRSPGFLKKLGGLRITKEDIRFVLEILKGFFRPPE